MGMAAITQTEYEEPRPGWLNWLLAAAIASLLFHLFLFFWFRSLYLEFGVPVVDPIQPRSFQLTRSTIDPRYLQAEAKEITGNQPDVAQEPMEILPGVIPSFSGPLNAPRIPTPTLKTSDVQSLSARETIVPRDAGSALPAAPEGNITIDTQALAEGATTAALNESWNALTQSMLAGGPDDSVSGQGLPGADEISQLMNPELKPPTALTRPPDQPILIRLRNDVIFEFDSAALTLTGTSELQKVANYVNQVKDISITVEGHTDSIGEDDYNLQLSQDRARAVADWFIKAASMDPSILDVKGYGESQLLVTSDAEDLEVRKQEERPNRRVMIRVEAVK